MNIIYENERVILINDNNKEVGELCYKYVEQDIVLIGTYIDFDYRGNGYFRKLLSILMENNKNTTIYICCIQPFVFSTIESMGFKRTNEPIPIWGLVSNGINFKYIP